MRQKIESIVGASVFIGMLMYVGWLISRLPTGFF